MNETSDKGNGTDSAAEAAAARNLVGLRRLVTLLTWVMILGIVVVIGLMVARLSASRQPAAPALSALPGRITLPDGAKVRAVTIGEGWYLVVTDADEVLIFDADSGALRQRIKVEQAQ